MTSTRGPVREGAGAALRTERRLRMVLVSSSAIVRYRLQRELGARGIDVEAALDVSDALAVAGSADVILVDAAATSAAGQHVVRRLKQAVGRVPVLFLDERSPQGDEHAEILRAGADGVVLSGDDVEAIAGTIALHLRST
jgi:CheY-like chemotaxis protein